MKAAFPLALILGATFAGCIDLTGTPDGPEYQDRTLGVVLASNVAPVNRTQQEYYFVLLSGHERADRIRGSGPENRATCDRIWEFDYDSAKRELAYDAGRFQIDPSTVAVVVAFDYASADVSASGTVTEGCGGPHDLQGFAGKANASAALRDLDVRLVVEPRNGFYAYNESFYIPMGQKVHVNLTRVLPAGSSTYYVTGDFEIVNLGAWPRSGLKPEY